MDDNCPEDVAPKLNELGKLRLVLPFPAYIDKLGEMVCDSYATASGMDSREVYDIYVQERQLLTSEGYPFTVIKSRFLRPEPLPPFYNKRLRGIDIIETFTAVSTVYPYVWDGKLVEGFIATDDSKISMALLGELKTCGLGPDTDMGKYAASLVILNRMRKEALRPLYAKYCALNRKKVVVTVNHEDVANRLSVLLQASMPYEFVANLMRIELEKLEERLFAEDHITKQLWRTLIFADLGLKEKKSLLNLIKTDRHTEAVEMLKSLYAEGLIFLPPRSAEELGISTHSH